MNRTMAPIDPDQLSLEDLKRRHGLHEDILLRQRRARGEGPEDGKPKDSDPPAGKGGGRSKGDDDDDKDSSLPTSPGTVLLPSSSSTQQTSTSVTSSTTALASAAATTVPTTITVIATPTSSPAVIPSTASLLSSDTISTSSLIPTTSSLSTQRTLPSATATPSEPRNGLNTDTPSPTNSDTTSSPSGVRSRPPSFPPSPVPETSHTPEPGWHGGNFNSIRKHKGNGLSPTAERLLIAVGAIGAVIIIVAGILLILRVKKIDAFSKFRNRKIRKGGNRGLYGWRRDDQYPTDAPPKYPSEAEAYSYPHDEKSIPAERQTGGFYSQVALPPLLIPGATLSRGDTHQQTQSPRALPNNSSPSTYIPSPQQGTISTTQAFYNVSPQTQHDLSRQISDANQTMRSQNTFASHQTSNIHEPSQNQVGHMSYLSSLSSGFGDGLIIPEASTNPNSRQTYRQSQNPSATASRFSWARSQGQGQRDTVYTTTSEESAPRFRSVTSWVAQQTGRVQVETQKKEQGQGQVPDVPAIPIPMPLQAHAGLNHQRNLSEDPVFKFHPGEEIQISRGSRVPSVILNKKTGIR